jgi:hypothetical protein
MESFFLSQNLLKAPAGQFRNQRDGSGSSGTGFRPAGRPKFERDDDFYRRGGKNSSGTVISTSGTAKFLAGRQKIQQGEWEQGFWEKQGTERPQNGTLTRNAIDGVDQMRTYSATALAEILIAN